MTMGTVEPLPKTNPAADTNAAADTNSDAQKKNRIQVSNTKKPLFFYVNLAKRYIQQHNEVELSALGMAITTVVTVAEILKNNGYATEKKVLTSTVGVKDEAKGRMVQKARIEIVLAKTEKVDKQMAPQNTNNNAATAGGAQDQAPTNTGSTAVMSAAGEENKVAQLQ